MAKHLSKILFGLIIVACFASCQRVIDIEVADAGSKLVIEGNLTDVTGTQTVIISRSVGYNNANVFPAVSGAAVSFVDGSNGKVSKLTETSTPGTYAIANFRGKTLNLYTLNVTVESKLYTATSVLAFPVNLDSLTLSNQVFGTKEIKVISVNYHDPANQPNQYKYVMYVNGVQVKRVFVENDNLTDGRAVSTMLYQREIDLKKGDKVEVEMQSIDYYMYNFWNNLSNQGGNSPQDSSTPANPPSNFNNTNVLGYFSAHTTQRKAVIIP
ncbi:MAG: DUF4249 family protein [Mucilaginibacter sp.]|uniref:DUF4249 family protein n=1 Tax=Mucilaginibacter sp. TaxID=1882438 RepID=UPI003262E5D7